MHAQLVLRAPMETGPGRSLDADGTFAGRRPDETSAVPAKSRGIRRHAIRDEFGVYHALRGPASTKKPKAGRDGTPVVMFPAKRETPGSHRERGVKRGAR
jgi:hypothetical protein